MQKNILVAIRMHQSVFRCVSYQLASCLTSTEGASYYIVEKDFVSDSLTLKFLINIRTSGIVLKIVPQSLLSPS